MANSNSHSVINNDVATLLDKGYDYAVWARGVAAGNTVTGEAAILFMQESSGRKFGESGLNAIRPAK